MNKYMITEPMIDEFIERSSYRPYENVCAKYLKGDQAYSLMNQLEWYNPESLAENIASCVRSMSRGKDNAVDMYRDFVQFLDGEYNIRASVDFPPVHLEDDQERILFINRFLQEDGRTRTELLDILWVSERTIADDISRLRNGDSADNLEISGRPFFVDGSEAANGALSFVSTAHPLFITPNLSQVIITLEGLRTMSGNPLFKTEAKVTAAEIWSQLSDYARRQISHVIRQYFEDRAYAWYQRLERIELNPDNTFHTERKTPDDRGFIFDSMKNQIGQLDIVYEEDGNYKKYCSCEVLKILPGNMIEIISEEGRAQLNVEKIKRLAPVQRNR